MTVYTLDMACKAGDTSWSIFTICGEYAISTGSYLIGFFVKSVGNGPCCVIAMPCCSTIRGNHLV